MANIKDIGLIVISWLGWLLLISTLGFYSYGIIEAIRQTLNAPKVEIDYPEFLSTSIGSIQGLLLTNLGILLGFTITAPRSGVAQFLKLSKNSGAEASPIERSEWVQLMALIIFMLALIASLFTLIRKDFSTDPAEVVTVITESGKMFIAVALAYLTVALRK